MEKSTYRLIKNLKIRESALSKPGIGMTLVGTMMCYMSNFNDPAGIIVIMLGIGAVSVAQEYRDLIHNVIDNDEVKIKTKGIK